MRPFAYVRARRDWSLTREGWCNPDGWTIRRGPGALVTDTVWIAFPPDGSINELQADDLCTCMERAEGMW